MPHDVELQPDGPQPCSSTGATSVHQFVHDAHLVERGLRNYWGYNSIGFLAPHNEYAAAGQRGEQVAEFKATVRALHEAGIEVIVDVVYDYTAEDNHLGPEFLAQRRPVADWIARLVDDGFGGALEGVGGADAFLPAPGASLMR